MAEMGIKIILQGGIVGTARDLNKQIESIKLNPLSIKVAIDSSGLNSTSKATKEVSEATQKAEKEMAKYWKSLQNTINEYKKQNTALDDYVKKLNSVRAEDKFKQLSDEKQIKIINSLIEAENKLGIVQKNNRRTISANDLKNQTIASNIGGLVGGGITARGNELENIRKLESEQISSINKIRQAALNSEAIKFNNIRRNQSEIEKENMRIASNIGNLIGGSITARGNELANTRISQPTIKLLDVDKAKNDLIRLEQSMSKIMGSPTWRSATKSQREEFDRLGSSIRSASLNLGNMSRSDFVNFLRNTKTSISGLNGEIQNADRNSLKLGDSLYQAMVKFPLWMGVSTIFMQFFHTIRDGIVYIKQFDDALVELQKVTEFTSSTYRDMQMSAISLGKELGKSSVDIMKSYAEFGKVTKIKEEIESLARVK